MSARLLVRLLVRARPSARTFSTHSTAASPPGAILVEPVRAGARAASKAPLKEECGTLPDAEDDLSDMVPMIDDKTGEWGGPTKGGSMPEPTRFGDWERKGRCTDFE